jgi:ketosteroid isomerase-like protein
MMSEHPHIARMRDAYLAFGKGDLAALQEIWSPELLWHAPGNSSIAGTYEGVAVVRLTGQREGRSLDVINAQISRFDGDRIVEFRDTSSDLDALDRFFA